MGISSLVSLPYKSHKTEVNHFSVQQLLWADTAMMQTSTFCAVLLILCVREIKEPKKNTRVRVESVYLIMSTSPSEVAHNHNQLD